MSFILANRNITEVKTLPIDRFYLETYLDEIVSLNAVDFIVFNFKWFPKNYTHRLMICLPELFSKLQYGDLVYIFKKLEDPEAVKSLIYFLNNYCPNINPFELMENADLNQFTLRRVRQHFSEEKQLKKTITSSRFLTKDKIGIDLKTFQESLVGVIESKK